ncbi:MAG: prepilin-type N-terminal cleavage/methylation domain-containing protein [Deinococcaceae bacterium]
MRGHRGFTFTEALVAMAVTTVAILMFGNITGSFSLVRESQQRSSAVTYGRMVVDSVVTLWRSDDFYRFNVLPNNISVPPAGYSVKLKVVGQQTMTYSLSCTSTTCGFGSPLTTADAATSKSIQLQVFDSTNKQIASLSSLVAKPAP